MHLLRFRADYGLAATCALVALAVAGLLLTAFLAANRLAREMEADPLTGCLVNRPAPVAVLVAIDTTDPLLAADSHRFQRFFDERLRSLPANSKVILIAFGGQLETLRPAIVLCTPGTPEQSSRWTAGRSHVAQRFQAFMSQIEKQTRDIAQASDAPRSPIAEHLIRLATDSTLDWSGERRELWLLSDGLQSVSGRSVYVTGRIELPPPVPGMLADTDVLFFELTNLRDLRLQTPEGRATWRGWFGHAGARTTTIEALGSRSE